MGSASASLVLLAAALLLGRANGFYLPGVAPKDFAQARKEA